MSYEKGFEAPDMAFILNPDKFIFTTIILFYFFSFIFISYFPINIIPLILGIPFYFLVFVSGFLSIEKKILPSWIMLVCFSLLAMCYLILGEGLRSIVSMEFFFFFSLPFIYLSVSRLIEHGFLKFVMSCFIVFLLWQLFVVSGQVMNNVLGYGFILPAYYSDVDFEKYSGMLTGTFVNANDLAASCGMIFGFFLLARLYAPVQARIALVICVLLAILTVSRSVLFFMAISFAFSLVSRSFIPRLLFVLGVFVLILLGGYFLQERLSHFDFVSRIFLRLESLWLILSQGLGGDNSVSLRLVSYFHFLKNLGDLGLGSISFRDYSAFVEPLGDKYELMGVNPHSFIIEVSYWMGLPGLMLMIAFIFMIFPKRPLLFLYVVFAFSLLSMVSSSIINNFVYMYAFFASISLASLAPPNFFIKKVNEKPSSERVN